MKVLARPRGTKKSLELLKDCSENNGIVLTLDKRALKVKAKAYGFPNIEIIDLDDLIHYEYTEGKPLYIHKAEDLLEEIMDKTYELNLKEIMVTTEE